MHRKGKVARIPNAGKESRSGAILTGMAVLWIAAIHALPAQAAPSPLPKDPGNVIGLEAGTEVWASLDYLEVQTFNEGVMERPEDRVRRTHEPARLEAWKFGERFPTFTWDGRRFTGRWRSAAFQAEYFTEYVLVEGEMAPGGTSVARMVLTKIRYETPSTTPPEHRGFTKIVLRFENLEHLPGLGDTVTFRFVPGRSRVTIEKAVGNFLRTEYHSRTVTTWRGLGPFVGRNEVTGQNREVYATVAFTVRRRSAPSVQPTARDRPLTVAVRGDSKLVAEGIAWLSRRRGVRVLDQTARSAEAVRRERALAEAGLLAEGTGPSAQAPATDPDVVVLEMTSTGRDPRDPSTRAVLQKRDVAGETMQSEVAFDLEMERYQTLGDEEFGDWVRLRTADFLADLAALLEAAGL